MKTIRAALLSSAKDISYLLGWGEQPHSKQLPLFDLSPDEQEVATILREAGPLPIDQLFAQLSISSGRLSQLLLQLELKQVIRALPGKRYALK